MVREWIIQKNLKQVLNEYYDKYYMNPLRKYFQQSEYDDEFKQDEMINCCYYLFPKWITNSYQVQEKINILKNMLTNTAKEVGEAVKKEKNDCIYFVFVIW